MPRPRCEEPSYCHHRSTGRAFVRLSGEMIYLGDYNTSASRDAYRRELGEWIKRGRQPKNKPEDPAQPGTPNGAATISALALPPAGKTIAELVDGFWNHAQRRFVKPDGKTPTAQLEHFRVALKILNRLYGEATATEFGPLAMQAVREQMLQPMPYKFKNGRTITRKPWSANYANAQVARLRRVLEWGMGCEMLPESYAGKFLLISKIENLQPGHFGARASKKVKPVADVVVDAILRHVPRQVKAMIELQRLTAARPGEICSMRGCDLDTTGKVWLFSPPQHKTAHLDEVRKIRLGPKGKVIVGPFLRLNPQEHLFSPADADREFREARAAARNPKSKWGNRPGTNRVRNPKKKPGTRYSVHSYRQAIERGCRKADRAARERFIAEHPGEKVPDVFVPVFKPHQIRHTAGTSIRKEFGLEAAAIIMGHRHVAAAEIYAEQDGEKATEIIAKIG